MRYSKSLGDPTRRIPERRKQGKLSVLPAPISNNRWFNAWFSQKHCPTISAAAPDRLAAPKAPLKECSPDGFLIARGFCATSRRSSRNGRPT